MTSKILEGAEGKPIDSEADIETPTTNLARIPSKLSPTERACNELQGAHGYFNRALFEGRLPQCMLTLDSVGRTAYGYFRPDSFISNDNEVIDQISINPLYITLDAVEALQTLVHEMCHQWVHRFESSKSAQSGYHCKKWSDKMISVGLMPVGPNGQKTGYRMSDKPIEGGKFILATQHLLDRGFAFTWGMLKESSSDLVEVGEGSVSNQQAASAPKDKTKGKFKWMCPVCKRPCWGSASLELACIKDNVQLVRENPQPSHCDDGVKT